MAAPIIFFVHLRQPRRIRQAGRKDRRDDPFYEFGSFGCTRCHYKNLFHPRHAAELEGSRLAFVQGGNNGSRLVLLTPPITVEVWPSNCEAQWTPVEMPFKYSEAPMLVANDGRSDFPLVKVFADTACRTTLEGGLSSRLRSRSRPLEEDMAKQIVSVYERQRKRKGPSAIATSYAEALPYDKTFKLDRDRRGTHRRFRKQLAQASRRCVDR